MMSDPLAVRVNVRSLRVTRPVGTPVALRSGMRPSSERRRTMLRNVTAGTMFLASALWKSNDRKKQHD